MKKLPNITGLRFFLALLVILFHVPQFCQHRGLAFFNDLPVFHRGNEAVYMFFSLSGFLIIRQLYEEKQKSRTINLRAFFLRRILRIFPLYYLVLGLGFFYYRFLLPALGYTVENNYDIVTGILLSISFFPNIFSTYAPGGIIEILWSIGIEEQFYLFIATLLFFVPMHRITRFIGIFTVLYFIIFFSGYFPFLMHYRMLFFYFSFSGLFSILMDNEAFTRFLMKIRYLCYTLLIAYFTTSVFENSLSDPWYHFFGMVLFATTLCILAEKPLKLLENTVAVYLGRISYGIYMFHAIVMQFVGFVFLKIVHTIDLPDPTLIISFNFFVIMLTIIVAHISFTYYENYFLKMKSKFPALSVPATALAPGRQPS